MNRAKLAVPSHSVTSVGKDWKSESDKIGCSESLSTWWEKIGKVVNQGKLAIPSHSEPLWWEKIGKVVTQTKSNFSVGGGGGTSARTTMSC